MARIETFARELRFAAQGLAGPAVNRALADFARAELARVIESGEGSPVYDRYVNGRRGAAEDAVEAPGPILYVFSWWKAIVNVALTELVKRSPRRSGRYVESFVVLVNGEPSTDWANAASDAEVIIFNRQPYTRKIEVGAMKMSVPPRHFEGARQALQRKFGGSGAGFHFELRFLTIQEGIAAGVPYILKGRSGTRRKDLAAGQQLTYPALVMNIDN